MPDDYGLYLSDLEFRNQFDIKSITEHIVTVSSVMLRGGHPKVTDVGIVPNLPEVKFGEKFVVYSNPFQLNEKYDNIQDYLVLNVEGQGLKQASRLCLSDCLLKSMTQQCYSDAASRLCR